MSGHHLPRFIVVVSIDFGEPLRTSLLVFFSRLPLLSVETYVSLKLTSQLGEHDYLEKE